MKRILCLVLALGGWATPARAYIDVTPTLGRLVNDASNVVVLQVEKVSREKRVIIYKKVADLKGQHPGEEVKHQITDGFHPREPASILDWAEPGQVAITFHNGKVAETCIGRYWYECSAITAPWWTMSCGQAQLCFAYCGSVHKLRHHVQAMLAGQEVKITAVRYGADDEYWRACKRVMAYRGLPRGKEYPLCRFKASLDMPGSIYALARHRGFVVEPGAGGPEDVPGLVTALRAEDWRVRLDAAEDLGLIGAEARAAVPSLVEALHDPEGKVRVHAAEALARLDPAGGTDWQTVLRAGLKERAGSVRRAAAEALGNLGTDARAAVPALAEALTDPDLRVRWAVADALGQLGPPARAAVPALVEALSDPELPIRIAALDALGWIGADARSAVPLLLARLEDADSNLRWAAAAALVRIDRKTARAAVPLFIQGLQGKDFRTRWHAVSYLMKVDREAKRGIPTTLLTGTLRDQDIGIRGMSAWILGEMGPKAKEAVPALTQALADPDEWVRTTAAPALVKILGRKATAAIPVLIEGLRDEDADIREDCLRGLKTLGPVAREAVPAVTRRLRDENSTIRLLAAETLWRVSRDARRVLAVLLDALRGDDKDVRSEAVHILGEIGPEAREAVPGLIALLRDDDDETHQAAAAVLRQLDPKAAARVMEREVDGPAGLGWKLAVWAALAIAIALPILFARLPAGRRGCNA